MKKAWLRLLFGFMACLFLFGFGYSFAQEEATEPATAPAAAEATPAPAKAGELPPPLEAEMTVAAHWSKNPYPSTVAAGSRVHVVERGDTLWDLAQRYYNNPFLWPQIWDANKYIPNAHWIYPGDPIVIPPLTPITEEQMAQETATEPGAGEEPGGTPYGEQKVSYPIADDADIYCSGFITTRLDEIPLKVVGNEQNVHRVAQSLFDIIYINQGEADGISPGDEFTALHFIRSIEHPVTMQNIGDYVIQSGRIKVVATQEHTSTAQVTYSCDAILVGDTLVPFETVEVPLMTEMPPVDRFSPEGPNAKGYVVFSKNDKGTVGTSDEIIIDMGAKDGITMGTRLVLYRFHEAGYEQTTFEKDLPRRVLGEMVVFKVRENSSVGKIIQMYDWSQIGDRVEVR